MTDIIPLSSKLYCPHCSDLTRQFAILDKSNRDMTICNECGKTWVIVHGDEEDTGFISSPGIWEVCYAEG